MTPVGQERSPRGIHLQAVRDGTIVATRAGRIYVGPDMGALEPRGRLPIQVGPRPGVIDRMMGRPSLRAIMTRTVGRFATHAVHGIDDDHLVGTSGRWLFRSDDGGANWTRARRLPTSSAPFGVLASAICSTDESIYVGEYPQRPTEPARVLKSTDYGRTWASIELPGVRHVHAVQTDPYSDAVWITTGDADAECRILRLRDGALTVVGGGSQTWRAVELAFTPNSILWGMDCAYARINPIFELDRDAIPDGDPRRVHAVDGSVYYTAAVDLDGERWVAFSSSSERGSDGSAKSRRVHHADAATVVLSSSASDYTDWVEVARYRKRRTIGDVLPGGHVPTTNAYVFIEAYGDSFLLNPFNTAKHDARLRRLTPGAVKPPTGGRKRAGGLPSYSR